MALSADILRGYTDTIILHQLSHGDSYGYQINKTISTLSGGEVGQRDVRRAPPLLRHHGAGAGKAHQRFGGVGGHETPA